MVPILSSISTEATHESEFIAKPIVVPNLEREHVFPILSTLVDVPIVARDQELGVHESLSIRTPTILGGPHQTCIEIHGTRLHLISNESVPKNRSIGPSTGKR
jgi:hypothetical protein